MPSQKVFLLNAQTGFLALTSSGVRIFASESIYTSPFLFQNTKAYYTPLLSEKKEVFALFGTQKRERRRETAAFFVNLYTRHQKMLRLRQGLHVCIQTVGRPHLRR